MTLAPTLPSRPTMEDPLTGTRVWLFDDSATVVNQSLSPLVDVATVRYLTRWMEVELQRRWVDKGRKVHYVHDWRSFEGFEPEARAGMISWGNEARKHTVDSHLLLSPNISPFLRIATGTALSVLRVGGLQIKLVTDLSSVLLRLTTPARS